ncbi:Transcription factor, MADS-box [Dillenia turbinata]|uniref:Transcription factor, MADS-box n=1 Tax=Dillenia turbinata TaxID=194707 RepID=A0AAN8WJ62_9MAGN
MGLIKKAKELSILCDIDVCLIIFAPNNDGQPEIWPRDPNKVRRMVNMYYGRSREPRRKRATNSSALFEARKNKIDGEIVNLRGVNAEPKDSTWDYRLNSLSYNGLKDLSSTLEKKIEQVELMAASSKSNQCLMESANTLVLMETSHQLSQYNSSCMGKHTMFQEAQSSPWTLTGSTNPQSHLCSQKVYREVSECLWPVIDMSPLASMPLFSPERMSPTQMMGPSLTTPVAPFVTGAHNMPCVPDAIVIVNCEVVNPWGAAAEHISLMFSPTDRNNSLGKGADDEFLASLANRTSLISVDLADNNSGGELPNNLSLQFIREELGMENQFSGVIPHDVGRLENLKVLYLGGNKFTGQIPSSLGNITFLDTINLGFNNLHGKILLSLSRSRYLTAVALAQNNLAGRKTREEQPIIVWKDSGEKKGRERMKEKEGRGRRLDLEEEGKDQLMKYSVVFEPSQLCKDGNARKDNGDVDA